MQEIRRLKTLKMLDMRFAIREYNCKFAGFTSCGFAGENDMELMNNHAYINLRIYYKKLYKYKRRF